MQALAPLSPPPATQVVADEDSVVFTVVVTEIVMVDVIQGQDIGGGLEVIDVVLVELELIVEVVSGLVILDVIDGVGGTVPKEGVGRHV
jgi:hypothetical protein